MSKQDSCNPKNFWNEALSYLKLLRLMFCWCYECCRSLSYITMSYCPTVVWYSVIDQVSMSQDHNKHLNIVMISHCVLCNLVAISIQPVEYVLSICTIAVYDDDYTLHIHINTKGDIHNSCLIINSFLQIFFSQNWFMICRWCHRSPQCFWWHLRIDFSERDNYLKYLSSNIG